MATALQCITEALGNVCFDIEAQLDVWVRPITGYPRTYMNAMELYIYLQARGVYILYRYIYIRIYNVYLLCDNKFLFNYCIVTMALFT